ncbi:MAG: hypothetical protein IBX57_01010 [Gammaproteobacteria bacterium]|nr:hypothetical protein [Gammaproteobacteria bacterium]
MTLHSLGLFKAMWSFFKETYIKNEEARKPSFLSKVIVTVGMFVAILWGTFEAGAYVYNEVWVRQKVLTEEIEKLRDEKWTVMQGRNELGETLHKVKIALMDCEQREKQWSEATVILNEVIRNEDTNSNKIKEIVDKVSPRAIDRLEEMKE